MTPEIVQDIAKCRLCADRFRATETAHAPRPVTWFEPGARLLIAGQAPGMRVHKSGIPFDDPSGDRLREWLGLERAVFYDKSRVAIVPMAFCFPGYNKAGSDLPPPPICRKTWHKRVFEALGNVSLRIIIGGYAHRYHLGAKASVTEVVRSWQTFWPHTIPLPHPSWRNSGWIKKNPWFSNEVLPALRERVQETVS